MKNNDRLEKEINDFLSDFGIKEMVNFIEDVFPIYELYNVEEDNDWVEKEVGTENFQNVRLIRTVYLMSKIAERHAGRFCAVNIKYKRLWERLEKFSNEL